MNSISAGLKRSALLGNCPPETRRRYNGDMTADRQPHKQGVADAARKMAELGLVVGTAGNVSSRVEGEPGVMAITPSGVGYEGLTADKIVVADFEMDTLEGDLPPSSESLLHVGIYRRRPDVRAVVHTHSIYSSVLAVSGIDLPPVIDEVAVYLGGGVRVSEYGFPGSEELASNVCDALGIRKAAFIANHGAVAVGESLEEALDLCLLVERASQIYVMARSLGQVTPIPPRFVEAQKAIYRMRNPRAADTGGTE